MDETKKRENRAGERKKDTIRSHAGELADSRVAIRHFYGLVDSGRRREIEKGETRDEEESRSANRVQGYANKYERVILALPESRFYH